MSKSKTFKRLEKMLGASNVEIILAYLQDLNDHTPFGEKERYAFFRKKSQPHKGVGPKSLERILWGYALFLEKEDSRHPLARIYELALSDEPVKTAFTVSVVCKFYISILSEHINFVTFYKELLPKIERVIQSLVGGLNENTVAYYARKEMIRLAISRRNCSNIFRVEMNRYWSVGLAYVPFLKWDHDQLIPVNQTKLAHEYQLKSALGVHRTTACMNAYTFNRWRFTRHMATENGAVRLLEYLTDGFVSTKNENNLRHNIKSLAELLRVVGNLVDFRRDDDILLDYVDETLSPLLMGQVCFSGGSMSVPQGLEFRIFARR
jgi:hypothetical protein